jgi:hypothetical protein
MITIEDESNRSITRDAFFPISRDHNDLHYSMYLDKLIHSLLFFYFFSLKHVNKTFRWPGTKPSIKGGIECLFLIVEK